MSGTGSAAIETAATLPLGAIQDGNLQQRSTSFSFDPLALLAVLHNPRASASAARLYGQNSLGIFRWPHTMMVGGALPPFKLLVDHLSSRWSSIHPVVEMFKADVEKLEVSSDISFSELPLSKSNIWLMDLLQFRPSDHPLNDIMIVHVESISGARKMKDSKTAGMPGSPQEPVVPWSQRLSLDAIGFMTTFLLLTGLVFSVLTGDMWATALFFVYFLHSLLSAAVSFVPMLTTSDMQGRRVKEDKTTRFAVRSRTAGGKVVFVGCQDTLETWARMAWKFQRGQLRNTLHWSWMVSGSLSAAASVVCMVNMAGYLQLAYLGTLVISSFGDLLVTRLVRDIQNTAIHYGDCYFIGNNEYWSQAIIRAALETSDEFNLANLAWCQFGLLPDIPLFRNLCVVLQAIRNPSGTALSEADIAAKLSDGHDKFGLAWRFAAEIKAIRAGDSAPTISNLFRHMNHPMPGPVK